ncbi:MAG: hypothetical protein HXY40_01790 [Chloroflexi bacterium]|nr:hypothetical protein [Chloroflexota bacterium]
MSQSKKPGRPFGLSLAIALSVIYFSLLPLLFNGLIWSVRQHFVALPVAENAAEIGLDTPLFQGAEGLPQVNLWQIVLSVVFLVVAVLAWRGRPPAMRFVLLFAIIGITVFNLALTFGGQAADAATVGIDSAAQIEESLSLVQLMSNALVVLYVLWYINRAPSRAFYRGYYLPEKQEEQK